MILLKIGDEQFRLPESRKEVTLRDMLGYMQNVEPGQPASMKCLYRYYAEKAKIQNSKAVDQVKADKLAGLEERLDADLAALAGKEKQSDFLRYYAATLSYFSGVPLDTMMRVRLDDLEKQYTMLVRLLNEQQLDESFTGFTFKGETYVLPERLPVPMENGTLIEFLEAEQYKHHYAALQEADGKDEMGFDVKGHYNALLPLVCILARKKNEPYSDKLIAERSELFLDLPVYYADQVFFYLARWNAISMKITNRLSAIGSNLKTLPRVPENLASGTAG